MTIKEHGPPPLDRLEDLLNTDDRFHGADLLRDPERYDRVLAHLGLTDVGAPDDLIDLRDALRTFVVGEPDADALNAVAARHPLRLAADADGLGVRGEDGVAQVVALVHEAVTAGTWARLRSCRNPACGWIYYDSSKNGSGRWCSTECSHVMRSRAYRARRTGAA